MLNIVIMRHGEASSHHPMGDHNRSLTNEGRVRIDENSKHLLDCGFYPEAILSSDARRTKETSEILKNSFPNAELIFFPDLYLAGYDEAFASICQISNQIKNVCLVGHNPGWSSLIQTLTSSPVQLRPGDFAHCNHCSEGLQLAQAFTDVGSWNLGKYNR